MNDYKISTKDGLDFRLSESDYRALLREYTEKKQFILDGNLITQSDQPKFRAPVNQTLKIAAQTFDRPIPEEQAQWYAACLQWHWRYLLQGNEALTYPILKRAREITGTWDFEDTLAVIKSDLATIKAEVEESPQQLEAPSPLVSVPQTTTA